MLTSDEIKAIKAALANVQRIIDGAQAREDAAAETAATTGYPAQRLTRQK